MTQRNPLDFFLILRGLCFKHVAVHQVKFMDLIILQLPSGDWGDNAISCCSEALMVHTLWNFSQAVNCIITN